MDVSAGQMVTYYSPSGAAPAIITRVNPDDTVSLTVFGVGETYYRDMISMVDGTEEDDDERVGLYGQ